MRVWIRIAIAATALVFALELAAQQNSPLTKQQIIEMSKAGLPEDVIIAKIRAEKTPLQVGTDDLVALKAGGVGDGVIRALMGLGAKNDSSPAPAATPAGDPDDPMSPHDPGVYLLGLTRDGKKKMVLIERAGSNRAHTANIMGAAFSYGIVKAKIKAELPERKATVRASASKPEFYMYFPPTGNLGAADTISSPNQFSLLELEVKKASRETTVGKAGFASASSGTDEKKSFKFTSDKIRPYAYKVVPETDLPEGEYAFVASAGIGGHGTSPTVVIFDFGVDK